MKEWYLIGSNTSPNMTGGYENQGFLDCRDDAFAESLQTEIATDAILYNCDLSEATKLRCIIQGNSADTQLKSMERIGLFVRGTVKAGMYIFFENRYWLITGYPSYNGIYEKAVMQLCQYKLRWQNAKGEIIERWLNATSSSKYDMGETGNSTIVLTSDNLLLLLPNDDESLDLDGKRVFIDKREVNPTKVYKITRTDSVLYDYGEHGGILSFIADKTELNTNTDRQDLRLCDYIEISDDNTEEDPTTPPENPDEMTDLWGMKLKYSTLKIKSLNKKYTVTAHLYDGDGVEVTEGVEYEWTVVSDVEGLVENYVTWSSDGNVLTLSVDNACDKFGEIVVVGCKDKITGHRDSINLEITEVW